MDEKYYYFVDTEKLLHKNINMKLQSKNDVIL